jgi:hypothetical protein
MRTEIGFYVLVSNNNLTRDSAGLGKEEKIYLL